MLTGVVVLWCHSAASAAVTPSDIMEEVPIEIHNSSMINALLYEIGEKGDSGCDFDRLDLSSNPFLVGPATADLQRLHSSNTLGCCRRKTWSSCVLGWTTSSWK
jgi:hypothetical protein